MPNPVHWIDPHGLTCQKEDANRQARSISAAQASKDPIFAGHGSINPNNKHIVPDGTSLTVYSADGASISDDLGQVIEKRGDLSGVYSKKYGPGDEIPEYVLHPNCGALNICNTSVQVKKDTPINELLEINMGDCHWAACTHIPGHKYENVVYDTDGIFHIDPISGNVSHQLISGQWVKIGE